MPASDDAVVITVPLMVPANPADVPQQLTWQSGKNPDGTPNAQILVETLMTTTLVVLDRAAGVALRDGLTDIFGAAPGLVVVNDPSEFPDGLNKPGPLGPFRA